MQKGFFSFKGDWRAKAIILHPIFCITLLTLLELLKWMGLLVVHIFQTSAKIQICSPVYGSHPEWETQKLFTILLPSVKDSFCNLSLMNLHSRSKCFSLRKVRGGQIFLEEITVALRQGISQWWGMPEKCIEEKDIVQASYLSCYFFTFTSKSKYTPTLEKTAVKCWVMLEK